MVPSIRTVGQHGIAVASMRRFGHRDAQHPIRNPIRNPIQNPSRRCARRTLMGPMMPSPTSLSQAAGGWRGRRV
jgi:hypothetical protein